MIFFFRLFNQEQDTCGQTFCHLIHRMWVTLIEQDDTTNKITVLFPLQPNKTTVLGYSCNKTWVGVFWTEVSKSSVRSSNLGTGVFWSRIAYSGIFDIFLPLGQA